MNHRKTLLYPLTGMLAILICFFLPVEGVPATEVTAPK